ncbi:hypothetical protein BJ508DRAFT_379036 [Ascobolus immersus RN42]|uniref:Uncharacterized protein n=1 Tax=Ascobolus immersus RN42 TaxID=1160509 RepID=A0A3N4HTN8_ASCIM|nr:hypothetical protein BJ508DRAFT_379036 [Ascobolus immersus RN42]
MGNAGCVEARRGTISQYSEQGCDEEDQGHLRDEYSNAQGENEFFVLSIDEAGLLFRREFQPAQDAIPDANGTLCYSIRLQRDGYDAVDSNIQFDPSARVLMFDLARADPFTTLPVDVIMANAIEQDEAREIGKTLVLWDVIDSEWDEKRTNKFVLTKLLSETPTDFLARFPEKASGATHQQVLQCFALIASRINIDDCSNTTEAAEFSKQSMFSHLRLLHTLDAHSGYVFSVTPSEPIVAQASAELSIVVWSTRAPRASFFVLQLLVLARDQVLTAILAQNIPASVSGIGTSGPKTGDLRLKQCSSFSLQQFLQSLLTSEGFKEIWDKKKDGSSSNETMGDVFAKARLNFSHFTTATKHFYGDAEVKHTEHGRQVQKQRELLEKFELLHLMLYRQAGTMAMALNQPDVDACLSIYFRDEDMPIESDELSVILIQTKNVQNGFPPPREPVPKGVKKTKTDMPYTSNFSHFPSKKPILGLIFNIGYKGKNLGVRQLRHAQDNTWFYDIRGSNAEVYECLRGPVLEQACRKLLGELVDDRHITPEQKSLKDTYRALSRITFAGQAGKEEKVRRWWVEA